MTLYGTVSSPAGPVTAGTVRAFVGAQAAAPLAFSSATGTFGGAGDAGALALPGTTSDIDAPVSFTVNGMVANATIKQCASAPSGTLAPGAPVTWEGGAVCAVTLALPSAPSQATVTASSAATSTGTGSVVAGGPAAGLPDTTATASGGAGTVAVAQYAGNPEPNAPTVFAAGTQYLDVSITPLSRFTSLTLQQCGATASETIYWWNGTAWAVVRPQSFAAGCISVTLDETSSSPLLSQLSGTPFVVATVAAPPGGGGGGGGGGGTGGGASSAPGVQLLSPAFGPAAGGTTVTVIGSGLIGTTAVDFGATPATSVTVHSDSELVAVDPAGTGTVDVTVVTAHGTSGIVPADRFVYRGSAAGGSSVGSAGGTLATADGRFTLVVPVGALSGSATLAVVEDTGPATGLPAGLVVASPTFQFTGTALTTAARATLRFDSTALHGLSASRLSVYAGGPGTWAFLPTAVDAASGTVSAPVTGGASVVVLAASQAFPDVAAGYWADGDVGALLAAGIAAGFPDGTFRPEAPLTRAQFVKMLDVTLGVPTSTAGAHFTDVSAADWFAPYVAAAVGTGLVQGLSPTTFGPGDAVTREQMAVLLARALKLTGTTTLAFHDGAAVDAWATGGVETAVAAGYLHGFPDGTFAPLAPTTRAQAAAVLAAVIAHEAAGGA